MTVDHVWGRRITMAGFALMAGGVFVISAADRPDVLVQDIGVWLTVLGVVLICWQGNKSPDYGTPPRWSRRLLWFALFLVICATALSPISPFSHTLGVASLMTYAATLAASPWFLIGFVSEPEQSR